MLSHFAKPRSLLAVTMAGGKDGDGDPSKGDSKPIDSRCTCTNWLRNIGKRMTEFRENGRLYEFLMGLDSDFATIRTQIISMMPSPTLGEAYHLVSENE